MIFTAGQRKEMGRYEVLVFIGFPGLGIGITIACFHRVGMMVLFMELLNMLHGKLMPFGPRCLRWRIVVLSGPAALEFLQFRIVSATADGLNWFRFLLSLWVA